MDSVDDIEKVTSRPFTIAEILDLEAARLCKGSPRKTKIKAPTGSTSELTKMAKRGKGEGHCIVRSWSHEKTPVGWGERNTSLVLNEAIDPKSLVDSDPDFQHLVSVMKTSRIPSLQIDDNGNEEVYRCTAEGIISRTMALSCFFFIYQWNKPENARHKDSTRVKGTLSSFAVLSETTSRDSRRSITKDIGVHVDRHPPIPILKPMFGLSSTTMMYSVNAKPPSNAEYPYQALLSAYSHKLVACVDEVMDLGLQRASEPGCNLTIQQLNQFLKTELKDRKSVV